LLGKQVDARILGDGDNDISVSIISQDLQKEELDLWLLLIKLKAMIELEKRI
jgi:hypothetical protein